MNKTEKELKEQIIYHQDKMEKILNNIKRIIEGKEYENIEELIKSYYLDSRHFYLKNMLIQSFEALMISWAYLDIGLKLGIFELLNKRDKDYFTIE